jgi:hypothetical protein
MLLTNTRVNLQYPLSFFFYFDKFEFFRNSEISSLGGFGVFVKNSNIQKCLNFLIPQYNELFIIIWTISVSGVVKFLIFWESFIFTKFWKTEFFWKKSGVVLVLEVSPMLLTNERFNLQYPSSFSWFRVFEFFRNSEISYRVGYWRFCEKLDFSKMSQFYNSSI